MQNARKQHCVKSADMAWKVQSSRSSQPQDIAVEGLGNAYEVLSSELIMMQHRLDPWGCE